MADLSTRFLGLELKNPIVVGSSGLTNSIPQIKAFAEHGAGAVVLKSVFEEEVQFEYNQVMKEQGKPYYLHEHLDYFDYEIKEQKLKDYIELIQEAKAVVDIPVIASINCVSLGDWVQFASRMEEAGADALELNLFLLPSDTNRTADDNYNFYINTVKTVLQKVNIPVGVKISSYFSDLGRVVKDLSDAGVAGITLFNRFYNPDIDIDQEKVIAAEVLSTPADYIIPLRWIGLMAGRIDCDLVATTGIHDGNTVVKMLLAGADAVQIASVLYNEGAGAIGKIRTAVEAWMNQKGYASLNQFKGKLSFTKAPNAGWYERVQFMTYFGEYNA